MKKRAIELFRNVGILLAIGIGYYIFHSITDIGIKCPFYLLTGFLCPGCGISRMFLALISLDFSSALYFNAAAFVLLPFVLSVLISYYYEYIKKGRASLRPWHKEVLAASVIVLATYGILRNVFEIGLHRSNNIDYKDFIFFVIGRYL